MKRLHPTAVLLLALALCASAQSGLIVRGGFNLSNAATDPDRTGSEPRPGFNGAVLGDVYLGGPLHLLVGGGYETRGVQGTQSLSLDYVTVPVMIALEAPFGFSGSRAFLNIGTESAFLVSSEADNFQDYELGVRSEVGMGIPVPGGPAVLVGAGYSYGLTDADGGEDEWHNHALHVFLGVKFGI